MYHSEIKRLFSIADNTLLCNTAYPYEKSLFRKYQSNEDIMTGTKELSFYLHVPFCRQLCSFCEYTRFLAGDHHAEERYIGLLENQVKQYLDTHSVDMILGLDIGGGTPTALPTELFDRLLSIGRCITASAPVSADFEKSIEFSFSTIDWKKLELIGKYGYRRISTGLQTADTKVLSKNDRTITSVDQVYDILNTAHEIGIHKINIDLMYGMEFQTDASIDITLAEIARLMPDQVTLYETRYNRNRIVPPEITRQLQYDQYRRLFYGLAAIGYQGRFGANIFSLCSDDGMSSYIRSRMLYGKPYKGFGISAQSLSRKGLSYGMLKNAKSVDFRQIEYLSEGDNYLLPPEELAAKYVSVALYGGSFFLPVLSSILGINADSYYHAELDYLKHHEYIEIIDDHVILTETGFR